MYAAAAKSLQSCPTLCNPIDGSPPGFPIPGILQARTLKWVAMSFSNAWKWKGKVKSLSHVRLLATPWTAAYQAPPPMGFPGKSSGVGCHCVLQAHVCLQSKSGLWPSRYTMTRMCSAVSELSCYITVYLQNVGREREAVGKRGLTTTILVNLLSPHTCQHWVLLNF